MGRGLVKDGSWRAEALCNSLYAAGSALTYFVAAAILVSALILIAGASISAAVVPVAAICAVAGTFLTTPRNSRVHAAAGVAIAAVVVSCSVLIAASVIDTSYDGNSYQKAAIGALAHGWNPVYESIKTWWARTDIDLSPVTHALWVDHYPKASWLFGASLYAATGTIESAKAINFIMAAAMMFVLFSWLRARFLGTGAAALVVVLAAVNPIVLPQLLTNYVDGLLACVLFLIITLLLSRADDGYPRGKSRSSDVLLAAAILICVNIKFTGFVYAGFFCGSFYVLEAIRSWKSKQPGALAHVLRRTGYYVLVVFVAAVIAGSNSYVRNLIDHGSPFYPLISSQTVDIVSGNEPDSFEDMNPFEQFARSLFSKTENKRKEPVDLKLPFTFSVDELSVSDIDTRRAGFGAFFSGIVTVSGAVCIGGLVVLWRDDRRWVSVAAALLVPMVALIGLTDGCWWARYTPYLWIIPTSALVLLLGRRDERRRRPYRMVLATALALIVAVDVATFIPSVTGAIGASSQVDKFIDEVKALDGTVDIVLGDPARGGWLYNIKDAGVQYRLVASIDEGDAKTLDLPIAGITAS